MFIFWDVAPFSPKDMLRSIKMIKWPSS